MAQSVTAKAPERNVHGPSLLSARSNIGNSKTNWSSGRTSASANGGAAYQQGALPVWAQNQTGFYSGPWDAFNMSQADFLGWIGSPINGVLRAEPVRLRNGAFEVELPASAFARASNEVQIVATTSDGALAGYTVRTFSLPESRGMTRALEGAAPRSAP